MGIGAIPNYIADADFNDDGLSDLVTVNDDAGEPGGGSVTVLINTPPAEVPTCDEDITGDGVINVLDLIDLLLCFGQPATQECQSRDVNNDGTVNVLDLIALLLVFGTSCP